MKKLLVLASASALWSLTASLVAPTSTETAVANGDTRTIHFYHTHTGESIDATFRVDGHYDQAVLDKLNYFLRDWRNNDQIRMDPRLFDTVWEVYRTAGADQPIQIYSAYRSPETNAMLRRRSRAVAEHSQHMLGKAMDTTMPGMSMERIREIGMRLQRGGVGYYQSANFVHLDVGGVRSWPRMNYDQLARLFPDGKTVHIPSNGQPMARYEEARAEIAARGGTDIPPAQESQGFFAWLFGGSGSPSQDEGDRTAMASRTPTHAQQVALAATANPEGDEGGVVADRARPASRQAQQAAAPVPAQMPVQPVAVESLQSADAASPAASDDKMASTFGDVIPLPPRRRMELASVESTFPLPPTRRGATFKLELASADASSLPSPTARPAVVPDAIGGLITTTTSGIPTLRHAALPAIITQGSEAHSLPSPALAFAAPDNTASLRTNVRETTSRDAAATHAAPGRALGLRAVTALRGSDHKNAAKPTAVADISPSTGSSPLVGPAILGLRKAAQNASRSAL